MKYHCFSAGNSLSCLMINKYLFNQKEVSTMKYREINSEFYCGVDVHCKRSYICVLDNTGKKYLNRSMVNNFQYFRELLHPFLPNVVVGCESTYSYYWLADGCHEHRIPFYLGHALYMKAISANKQKNDKLDTRTIAERKNPYLGNRRCLLSGNSWRRNLKPLVDEIRAEVVSCLSLIVCKMLFIFTKVTMSGALRQVWW